MRMNIAHIYNGNRVGDQQTVSSGHSQMAQYICNYENFCLENEHFKRKELVTSLNYTR